MGCASQRASPTCKNERAALPLPLGAPDPPPPAPEMKCHGPASGGGLGWSGIPVGLGSPTPMWCPKCMQPSTLHCAIGRPNNFLSVPQAWVHEGLLPNRPMKATLGKLIRQLRRNVILSAGSVRGFWVRCGAVGRSWGGVPPPPPPLPSLREAGRAALRLQPAAAAR